jgi:hypothetical protein
MSETHVVNRNDVRGAGHNVQVYNEWDRQPAHQQPAHQQKDKCCTPCEAVGWALVSVTSVVSSAAFGVYLLDRECNVA